MTKVEVQIALSSGETITNVGQLSSKARAYLKSCVRAGTVSQHTNYSYPAPKQSFRPCAGFTLK